ncbi:MAG: hypothetical protein ACLGH3_07930 [Actinomycetota bacterium]
MRKPKASRWARLPRRAVWLMGGGVVLLACALSLVYALVWVGVRALNDDFCARADSSRTPMVTHYHSWPPQQHCHGGEEDYRWPSWD